MSIEPDDNAALRRLSHELATPLATIALILDALEVPEADQEMLEAGRRALAHLQSLTATAGQVAPDHAQNGQVDMTELIAKALEIINPLSAERNTVIRFVDQLEAGESAVTGDQVGLTQVLINLLCNAIKFSPLAGVIDVKVTVEGGQVLVDVIDRGPGIPETQFESLMTEGTRLQRDAHTPGSGIGLAVVADILAAHGSKLQLVPTDEGAFVRFAIPSTLSTGNPSEL